MKTLLVSSFAGLLSGVVSIAQPNLRPFPPAGWPAPLIISTHQGDRLATTEAYDDQDLYVDWAVRNTATVTAVWDRFYYRLSVDGFKWFEWYSDYVSPGSTEFVEDHLLGRLNVGVQTVRIEADVTRVIRETNEADNAYERQITILPRRANGHFYALTTKASTWHQAQAEAASYGGHLVTITSSSEQRFVMGTFLRNQIEKKPLWIGLTDHVQEGVYRWVTGEPFEYANWNSQEPNNCGDEDFVAINWHVAHDRSDSQLGDWNDSPAAGSTGCLWGQPENYYGVIEWNTAPANFPGTVFQWDGPVAEPEAVWRRAAGGNDHAYQAFWVAEGITWDEAKAFAEARGGTLASITSSSENTFVAALIQHDRFWQDRRRYGNDVSFGPWLGGYQPAGAPEPTGGWRWTTGETLSYSNWDTHQPDNYGPNGEGRLQFFQGYPPGRRDLWNDEEPDSRMGGFVVEFSGALPQISSVSPNPVIGSDLRRTITINGANFVNKPTVTLTWTGQPGYRVPEAQVTFVSANKLEIAIVTGTAADMWTVRVTNPDGRSSEAVPLTVHSAGCSPGPSAFGLTILTHGWFGETRSWITDMSSSMRCRMGGGVPVKEVSIIRSTEHSADLAEKPPDVTGVYATGAGILLIDWSDAADGVCWAVVPTKMISDQIIVFLDKHPQLYSMPVHLVGHSRGGSVMSAVANALGMRGIWVDHVTFLDPRPLPSLVDCLHQDFPARAWDNILFADNYYQDSTVGGIAVEGTYQPDLRKVVTGDGYDCMFRPGLWGRLTTKNGWAHEQIHTWYHGTVSIWCSTEPTPLCVDDVLIQREWYESANLGGWRRETGYHFSRTGGGDRYSGKALEGLHYRLARSATANREPVQVTQPAWPNATLKPLGNEVVQAGEEVQLIFFYQDADSPMTVEFHLDKDSNPFNNQPGDPCYRLLHQEAGLTMSDEIQEGTFDWTPREADVGTWYLQIKATDGLRVRYDYLTRPITITASGQPPSDLVIENLRVSPGQAIPGEAVTVSFSIRNVGGGVAYPSSANVRLNASSTTVLASDEPLALGLETPRLLPGTAHDFNQSVTLPAVSASGTYYVWVIADVGNRANQSDTSDASDTAKFALTLTVPPRGGIGDWVEVYGTGGIGLRVRGPEPCDLPLEGAKRFDGQKGLVLAGPRTCDIGGQNYTLWKIRWADCVEGWSAQEWLRKAATSSGFDCARELQVTELPAVGGRIVRSPAKTVYEYLDLVTLIADAAPGYYLESWEGEDEASGLTAQVTMYTDRAVTAHFQRTEPDPDCVCPAECAAESGGGARLAQPGEAIDLNLLRRFRDEVLTATPEGQALTEEFYRNSAEILHHMAADPAVLTSVQDAIVSLQPTLRDLVDGNGQQAVPAVAIETVNTLAQQLHQAGGVVLRSAIESELERTGPLNALVGQTSAEARRKIVGTYVRIVQPRVVTGGFEFRVTGDVVGALRAESSDDLRSWTPLADGVIPQLPATVRDANPPASGSRYYRVVSQP